MTQVCFFDELEESSGSGSSLVVHSGWGSGGPKCELTIGGDSPLGKARWESPVCGVYAQRPLAQKRTPQWTPADTQAHAVTRVRHTRAVHAPALCRTSDCTCLCVQVCSSLSSTSPTAIPVRILREVDRVRAGKAQCVESTRNVPSHKNGHHSGHQQTHKHTQSLS